MDLKMKLNEIMKGDLSEDERSLVQEKNTFFSSPQGIEHALQTLSKLQSQFEEDSSWNEVALKARDELSTISDSTFLQLLTKFSPFIKSLPSGHSRGHLLRTHINSTLLLYDPETIFLPEEMVVGMIASLFHDIGRFVMQENEAQADRHAEIGAAIFDEFAKDILPPNLFLMTKYAIATHTKIGKSNTEIDTATTYNDILSDGHKASLWMTKFADRLDARGLFHSVRLVICRTNSQKDFQPGNMASNELATFAQSDTANPPVYNLNLSSYFSERLFAPEDLVQKEFLGIIHDESHNVAKLSEDERIRVHTEGVEKFVSLAKLLEPGHDLSDRARAIEHIFSYVTDNELAWLLGFIQLYDKLYPEVFGRKEQVLKEKPNLRLDEVKGEDDARRIVGELLYPLAKQSLEYFKQVPTRL